MALIQPTRGPEYWAVEDAGEIIVAGTTVVGQATATAPIYPVYRGTNANTFLGTVRGKARRYNPLPDSGEMAAGDLYGDGGDLVIVAQAHRRNRQRPVDAPELYIVYRPVTVER